MTKEELKNINDAQAKLILSQIEVKTVKLEAMGDDYSLWNDELDTHEQMEALSKSATVLGVQISDMIEHALTQHGSEVVSSMPENSGGGMAAPLFTAINAYAFFVEDMLADFYMEHSKRLFEEERDSEVEEMRGRFGLYSYSHDSHWSVGIGEKGYKKILSNFDQERDNMEHVFDWKDFAEFEKASTKYPGEGVYLLFGEEVEDGGVSQGDVSALVADKFLSYIGEKFPFSSPTVENRIFSALEASLEEDTPSQRP